MIKLNEITCWDGVTKCAAIQMSDQMVCSQCRLSWDMNDTDRPVCQAKGEDGGNNGVMKDLTLRDHFAGVALSGSEADHTTRRSYRERAEHCYKMADAMMEQRLK